jgi:hypothetical protein
MLVPANYVQKHGKNEVPQVSEGYKFKKENKFEYIFWSDDLGSMKYGVGNFKVKQHQLLLEFTDEPLPRLKSALTSKKITSTDLTQNIYQVHVKTDTGTNLPGVNILLISVNNNILTGTATDSSGMAKLVLAKESIPNLLKVSFIGFEDLIFKIDQQESMYFNVTLAGKYGARITDKQRIKRIKIKNNSIVIDQKEFEIAPAANYNLTF